MNLSKLLILLLMLPIMAHAQDDVDVFLIARNTGEKVLANGDTIRVFGFAESLGEQPGVPGPPLVMNEGDSVHIDVWNVSQGAPHTIHLHGLDVNQENDGVPHLSWDIPHMQHGFYHFKAPHPGTYLYHCHVASTIHVQAGMYGLIIVKPSDGSNTTWDGGYEFTTDYSYFLSEIDTTWHRDEVLLHEHDTMMMVHPVSIPVFDPQFFLINGFSDQQLEDEDIAYHSTVNQVDHIRLANIGYCGTRVIFPPQLNAEIIASDGRPLNVNEVSDTVYVYPGERYDVLSSPGSEFVDEIQFEYFDLNTLVIKGTQYVAAEVIGFYSVGEQSIDQFTFRLAPNPSNGIVRLEFDLPIARSLGIRVTDVSGRLVEELPVQGLGFGAHSIALDLQGNPIGPYVITVLLDDGSALSQILILD
jgi:FtsP/CotA-like multicopper oxidase with cupredoxin domain